MSIKIFFDEWFHHTPNLILNKRGKTPVHHLSILGIELGSLGCTTACPTTEPRLSLQGSEGVVAHEDGRRLGVEEGAAAA